MKKQVREREENVKRKERALAGYESVSDPREYPRAKRRESDAKKFPLDLGSCLCVV